MTQSDASSGVSSYVAMMFATDAVRFSWRSGTRLGRLVVPLVCSTRPMSPAADGLSESP